MGHNSFIKGSITRLTGVQSLSGAAFHCSYIWLRGRMCGAPVREQRTPPTGMAVIEVSLVELYSFLFCPFSPSHWLHQECTDWHSK